MKRTTVTFLSLFAGSALFATVAWAGSWGDYDVAFPAFPCNDGWMACYQGGTHLDPDLQKGSSGLALPANQRVDWYDLEATEAFSPFVGLSEYPLTSGPVVDAEPIDEPVPEPVVDGGGDYVPEPGVVEPADGGDAVAIVDPPEPSVVEPPTGTMTRPTEPETTTSPTSMVRPTTTPSDPATTTSPTSMVRPTTTPSEPATTTSPTSMVRPTTTPSEPATTTSPTSMVRPTEPSTPATPASTTPTGTTMTRPTGTTTPPASTTPPPTTPPPAVTPASTTPTVAAVVLPPEEVTCDDLVRLEPAAMMGKLSDEQIACLEASLAATDVQTEKRKISLVLMANAWAKGDQRTWEKLVKRHLDEIDQSDPDLCYKYALYLSKKGPGRAWGVIQWSDVALENRTVWVGETYKSRVYNLYKLRAGAAQELWKQAEEKHASAPTDETGKEVDEARGLTKTYAREWYEYAKEAEKDTTTALQLCISAAGTAEFCEGK